MKTENYNINWNNDFKLNESSPSGLDKISFRGNKIEPRNVGTKKFLKAGQPHAWGLRFNGVHYLVHRIIWVLKYGSISSDLVIDHIDGNPFNNSIENLSLKTQGGNCKNRAKFKNNTSGTTGVRLHHNGINSFYYVATWYDLDRTYKSKYFSIDEFGEENAKILAALYREQQMIKLLESGADYTERHGK